MFLQFMAVLALLAPLSNGWATGGKPSAQFSYKGLQFVRAQLSPDARYLAAALADYKSPNAGLVIWDLDKYGDKTGTDPVFISHDSRNYGQSQTALPPEIGNATDAPRDETIHGSAVYGFAFSPDGSELIYQTAEEVSVWALPKNGFPYRRLYLQDKSHVNHEMTVAVGYNERGPFRVMINRDEETTSSRNTIVLVRYGHDFADDNGNPDSTASEIEIDRTYFTPPYYLPAFGGLAISPDGTHVLADTTGGSSGKPETHWLRYLVQYDVTSGAQSGYGSMEFRPVNTSEYPRTIANRLAEYAATPSKPFSDERGWSISNSGIIRLARDGKFISLNERGSHWFHLRYVPGLKHASVSPNGDSYLTLSESDGLKIYSVDREQGPTVTIKPTPSFAEFSPDGFSIVTISGNRRSVEIHHYNIEHLAKIIQAAIDDNLSEFNARLQSAHLERSGEIPGGPYRGAYKLIAKEKGFSVAAQAARRHHALIKPIYTTEVFEKVGRYFDLCKSFLLAKPVK